MRCAIRLAGCLGVACYTPPDLPLTPYQTPWLSDGALAPCAPDRVVRVGCVLDGDTVDLGGCGGERIRLLGIDAPELAHGSGSADCHADTATAALRAALDGLTVRLSFDQDCTGFFGRTLAYVWLTPEEADRLLEPRLVATTRQLLRQQDTDDVLVNAYALAAGWARRYDEGFVDPLRWEPALVAAERLAIARHEGLWGACR